ncbi:polymer-forming cytoskeletal protein [Novosphingobium sp. P6W]|jgi:cytoskeletal protein CcmA (bactofilin family)|uniref:bactofilin family protein n=1 Tax=Novosphingobium sp. P6W TaxID=1609758 RepID=UPI0005C3072B|nr:polymer-forming cytoskeletal protein [Novosphingobium sp. P6W]AXB75154.1 polymer-forming cytoskeletal protein [Novosphingobium sp. P6W]KIS32788.1 cell shape determination protein CcmA [Novosphingobium sp. P6W]
MAKAFISSRVTGTSTSFSMLGSDTTITGNIQASADLHVDGSVEGDITCNSLVQGEGSEITGAVRAESVRIAGLVRGSVAAREVVILKTARIEGDVAYDALTIEQGARLEGRLSPSGGQIPPAMARLPAVEAELMLPAAAE